MKCSSQSAGHPPVSVSIELRNIPAFGKDLKMSNSYPKPRYNIQPSARIEKYSDEAFDVLKDFCNDKECQDQNFLIATTNSETVKKINVLINKEIVHCVGH